MRFLTKFQRVLQEWRVRAASPNVLMVLIILWCWRTWTCCSSIILPISSPPPCWLMLQQSTVGEKNLLSFFVRSPNHKEGNTILTTHQSSGSQSRNPFAKGLLAILSWVICNKMIFVNFTCFLYTKNMHIIANKYISSIFIFFFFIFIFLHKGGSHPAAIKIENYIFWVWTGNCQSCARDLDCILSGVNLPYQSQILGYQVQMGPAAGTHPSTPLIFNMMLHTAWGKSCLFGLLWD